MQQTIADTPCYAFHIAPDQKLMTIRMTGLWTTDVMAAYERDLVRTMLALRNHGCSMGEQATLLDASEYCVQSREIAAAHERIAAAPETQSKRVAVVTGSGLLKLQALRIAPGYRIFASRHEALRWLMEFVP